MIRFEQDLRGAIEQTIREEVRVDIHFDLYDVDRAADAIAGYVELLESKIKLLEAKLEQAADIAAGEVYAADEPWIAVENIRRALTV